MFRNMGSNLFKLLSATLARSVKASNAQRSLRVEGAIQFAPKQAQYSFVPSRHYQSRLLRPAPYQHFRGRQPWWQSQSTIRIIAVVTGAGGVYYVAHIETVPYTHRRHAVLVSPATERSLGTQTFKQFRDEAEAAGKLLPVRHPLSRAVREVGLRIAAVAQEDVDGQPIQHMKDLQWEFAVINEPGNVNAFVAPGGKVVFYTGLLHLLKTQDEIAAVMGHEAAHVVARHTGEKLSSTLIFAVLQVAAGLLLGIHLPADLAQLVIFLPNSRKQESEADAIGMQLAAKACFSPGAAALVFQKLGAAEQQQGVQVPTMLRTHPQSKDRVKAIEHNLPKAEQQYELAGCRAPKSFFGSGTW